MKRKYILISIVVLLLVDYAALDDITTNPQENYYAEYSILIVSLILFTLIGKKILEGRKRLR